ncbi:hypothetical protein B0H14DRAFT_2607639 [Mycena olivaceomarginata]|nr:hypothetical protein B0H14DRAFT_2607639 [Mycena olivaceomarginata]
METTRASCQGIAAHDRREGDGGPGSHKDAESKGYLLLGWGFAPTTAVGKTQILCRQERGGGVGRHLYRLGLGEEQKICDDQNGDGRAAENPEGRPEVQNSFLLPRSFWRVQFSERDTRGRAQARHITHCPQLKLRADVAPGNSDTSTRQRGNVAAITRFAHVASGHVRTHATTVDTHSPSKFWSTVAYAAITRFARTACGHIRTHVTTVDTHASSQFRSTVAYAGLLPANSIGYPAVHMYWFASKQDYLREGPGPNASCSQRGRRGRVARLGRHNIVGQEVAAGDRE